jgi:hypothetical protein
LAWGACGLLVVDFWVLCWGVAVGGDESGVARACPGWLAGADELDAEVPLVAVVEQEQEFLVGRSLGDRQVAGSLLGVTEGIVGQQGVLAGAIPRLAAEEERPQVRVVEPEGEGDGVAEVGQGLVGGQFQLPPDPPGARRGIEATEDADAEGVGGRATGSSWTAAGSRGRSGCSR